MALAGGADPSSLILHGNAKTDAELELATRSGVGLVVIDNFDDIARLERIAETRQPVLIRVIPGVNAPTHDAMDTGGQESKFGLAPADVQAAIRRVRASSRLRLDGLHVHIGSEIHDTTAFVAAVEAVSGYGEFPVYDLGGGLGARHTYAEHPPSVEDYLDALVGAARLHLPDYARLIIEPGRSMVAEAGVSLYRVVTVKRGTRTFVAVDGGMGDNLEVSLYGQRFEAAVGTRLGGDELCDLVGRHCESGDRLVHGVHLDAPHVGDLVVVPVTGAYCVTMANNYNGALKAPVVFCRDGAPRAVVRRETYDDLTARDLP
jgi:diaminopimelate decarboxylase